MYNNYVCVNIVYTVYNYISAYKYICICSVYVLVSFPDPSRIRRGGIWQHVIHSQCLINQLLNHMLMFTHMVIIGGWCTATCLQLCLVSGDEALPREWRVQTDSRIQWKVAMTEDVPGPVASC